MSGASSAPGRDPALGLLDRLVRDALDQGYRDAAERRTAGADPDLERAGAAQPWWRRHGLALLGLILMAAVVTLGAVQQLTAAPATAARKEALAGTITDATRSLDSLELQVREVTAAVADLQSGSLGSGAAGRRLQDQLDRLGPVVGTADVIGPGLVITVDDAPSDSGIDPDLGRVLDRDLQHIANGLWQSGAEAIDINGQRLTSLSAIRAAGDAVLVNYRPLVRPYVVTAVGDPETLGPDFAASSAGTELETLHQTYGIRYDVRTEDRVTIPGEPATQLHEAKQVVP